MEVLVTGAAGFIGSHLCDRLLARGDRVWAVDNFDSFYDPAIKHRNVAELQRQPEFRLIHGDILDPRLGAEMEAAGVPRLDVVVHLAARAGVRPSIETPVLYHQVNSVGTAAVLELARSFGCSCFVFASSSSVYGDDAVVPFTEHHLVSNPISPYAATKRAGELTCHVYHHLHGMSIACLRLFTVYGPRQRPDLAIHKFAKLLVARRPIPLYGDGSTERDYTYVDDIVSGIVGAIGYTRRRSVFEIVNLGASSPTRLSRLVELLGEAIGVEPRIEHLARQPGDVQRTFADISRATALFGYRPTTGLEAGITRFAEWFGAAEGQANRS